MQAIVDACAAGEIDGRVVLVVGNYGESPALERARMLHLETHVVSSPGKNASAEDLKDYENALLALFACTQPDLIVLAGYLLKLPDGVVRSYRGRIMNMHNALLPAFGGRGMYGARVHEAVVAHGVKYSGCTVHFVDESYDTGPIILQSVVPVEDDDTPETLAARVLVAEHQTFPRAIALFAQGRLEVVGRKVITRE